MSRASNAVGAADEEVVLRVLSRDYGSDDDDWFIDYVGDRLDDIFNDDDFRESSLLQVKDVCDINKRGVVLRVVPPTEYDKAVDLDKNSDEFKYHLLPEVDNERIFYQSTDAVVGSSKDLWYKMSPRLVAECKALDAEVKALLGLSASDREVAILRTRAHELEFAKLAGPADSIVELLQSTKFPKLERVLFDLQPPEALTVEVLRQLSLAAPNVHSINIKKGASWPWTAKDARKRARESA